MGMAMAFLGTAIVTLAVQTLRWAFRRSRDGERLSWLDYLRSTEAWGAGWPIAMMLGTWMTLFIFALALS